jgi:hypothetical protein
VPELEMGEYQLTVLLCGVCSGQTSKIIHKYSVIQQAALKLGLDRVWDMKPLVDVSCTEVLFGRCFIRSLFVQGNDLRKRFGYEGKLIGAATDTMIRWQLRHPHGSIEECVGYLADFKPV